MWTFITVWAILIEVCLIGGIELARVRGRHDA